jgi:hypothetical protein
MALVTGGLAGTGIDLPTSAGALPCRTSPGAPGAISFSAFR